ncbi:hypothetical protein GGR21_001655 [Dysgonomonas hofstadii]|uniref:Uncharacterized protein n=1 Tax=Dysgonomonas hofstadii TaxID=637886 RepID=A0A840CIH0_9BACT|nr:hypothetical protein [Dysgonomonas hofstadii]MBB4035760.1 hypothetical protein [Dysgonomonas hofstadii]
MKNLITYLFSKKKKTYSLIAGENKCSALRVCALAHGAKAVNSQDYAVIQALVAKGIVTGVRFA